MPRMYGLGCMLINAHVAICGENTFDHLQATLHIHDGVLSRSFHAPIQSAIHGMDHSIDALQSSSSQVPMGNVILLVRVLTAAWRHQRCATRLANERHGLHASTVKQYWISAVRGHQRKEKAGLNWWFFTKSLTFEAVCLCCSLRDQEAQLTYYWKQSPMGHAYPSMYTLLTRTHSKKWCENIQNIT